MKFSAGRPPPTEGQDVTYTVCDWERKDLAGANGPGGYRVKEKDWRFASSWNSKIWLGNLDAGMHFKATTGAGRLREDGDAVLVSNLQGDITLEPGARVSRNS